MTDPTLDAIALIDENIILRKIEKEWEPLARGALSRVAKQLEEKWGYKIAYYDSDGIWEITPSYKLQQEISKIRSRRFYEKDNCRIVIE